jgi:hypothetical protein
MTASLQPLTTADSSRWRALLPARRSAFGSLEFARITEQHTTYSARLLLFTDGAAVISYPSFLRPVSVLPFAGAAPRDACDSVSPEYTGPLTQAPVTGETAHRFREHLATYCQREGIVAEFGHLHPWNAPAELLAAEHVSFDREIVYVDLDLPHEQMWHGSFSHACRKNIQRALSERVRVVQAATPDDIREVHRVYTDTMDRRGALTRYCYPLSYFMAFFRDMPDNATFFLARYRDRVVAATLYLHDDLHVYSYLGGADPECQRVRPTNAVVYEAVRWAQRRRKRRFVLGGGYHPDDGIFRFKASFSPLRAGFHVYRRIQMPDEYARLCGGWSSYYDHRPETTDYFPAYRSVPVTAGRPRAERREP